MVSELGLFNMGVTAAILRAGGTTRECWLELTSINVNGSQMALVHALSKGVGAGSRRRGEIL